VADWREDALWMSLRNSLFHATSVEAFRAIRADGFIKPNQGQFEPRYPQARNSYSWKKPAVALFDIESATDQELDEYWWNAGPFLYDRRPAVYVLILNRQRLKPLIRHAEAYDEMGLATVMIPHLEVWSSEPIPFAAVSQVMVCCFGKSETFDPDDPRLLDADTLVKTLWPASHARLIKEAEEDALTSQFDGLSSEELRALFETLESELKRHRPE
jgi:hypothetical protein